MPRLSDCLLAAGNGKVTGHVNGKTFSEGRPRLAEGRQSPHEFCGAFLCCGLVRDMETFHQTLGWRSAPANAAQVLIKAGAKLHRLEAAHLSSRLPFCWAIRVSSNFHKQRASSFSPALDAEHMKKINNSFRFRISNEFLHPHRSRSHPHRSRSNIS